MDEMKTPEAPAESMALTTGVEQTGVANIWIDDKAMQKAFRGAKYLASSELVPEQTYRNKPQNCLIALDLANRLGMSPLVVMQNLYIVKGKPSWSGQFCVSAVNGSGRFTPLEYLWNETGTSCAARAIRLSDHKECLGATISMQMAKDEGWLDKSGSKWKTMPQQMLMYRAAAFFARTFCPDLLMGIQTAEEVRDVYGEEESGKPVVVISLDEEGDESC